MNSQDDLNRQLDQQLDQLFETTQKRIGQLEGTIRELCNMIMILRDGSKDEALRTQADRLVRRAWERVTLNKQ